MVTIGWSIFIGIISGVITSALVSFSIKLFKDLVVPWIQSLTYQGVKISGTWIGFYSSSSTSKQSQDDPSYTIYIKQKGHSVEGEMIRNKDGMGRRDVKAFLFSGLFKDKNLVLHYRAKDETRLGSGSYVMKLVGDGRKFEGKSLYITSGEGNVAEFSVYWERKN
jgi:hypothetical protein